MVFQAGGNKLLHITLLATVSLKPFILQIIKKSEEIGLSVICVTGDMGGCNLALWRSFGIVCARYCKTVSSIPHPYREGRTLYFMHDVPHIVKNIWVAMVNGNIITLSDDIVEKFKLPSKEVKLDHFKTLLEFQKNKQLKLAPKFSGEGEKRK